MRSRELSPEGRFTTDRKKFDFLSGRVSVSVSTKDERSKDPTRAGSVPMMRNVLLCASQDCMSSSRLPRLFAEAGCRVTVLSRDGLALNASRYVTRRIRTGPSPEQVRQGLEAHIASAPDAYDWIVLTDEAVMRAFLEPPASPELASRLPLVADASRLAQLLSKAELSEQMRAAGIPVPAFRVVRGWNEPIRQEYREPFVVKIDASHRGFGVRIVKSAREQLAQDAVLQMRPIVLQRYIAGPIGATSVLFEHGVPKCWFSYLLRRNGAGDASVMRPFWRPEIESILATLGEMTGFHGLCGVDWVIDGKRGTLFVLEMNPRPTSGLHASGIAGVSFSRAIAEMLDGGASAQRPTESSCVYRLFPESLAPALAERDLQGFLRSWKDAPWGDPLLLLQQLRFLAFRRRPAEGGGREAERRSA
jgi:glutathione synthase/RimK-type ligase-like ATP-grasp enzyme